MKVGAAYLAIARRHVTGVCLSCSSTGSLFAETSMMNRMTQCLATVQIIAATLSAICLGAATWITTLQTPTVEEKIADADSAIQELRHRTTKDLVQGLYVMDLSTERRINLVDLRLERMMNSSRTTLEESLLKEVMDSTSGQIVRWNSMFLLEKQQDTDVNQPLSDPNIPIERRILILDNTLVQARKAAYSRLDELVTLANEHELEKVRHDKTLKSLGRWFRFCQIIGLLTLVIALGLEAYKKLKEAVIDNKKTAMCEPDAPTAVADGPLQS